jgi:selenium metabolism protein YedF
MLKINAIGDVCPIPVIKAKKALKENSGIMVTVDNEIATQNLAKMAEQLGFQVKIEQRSNVKFDVAIFSKDELLSEKKLLPINEENQYIVVIDAKTMGSGNDELGYLLLKGFIYSLTEQDRLPNDVIFYNGGAWLTTTGSEVLDDLKALKDAGVGILTCGACLDYFDLKEQLAVGEITNMYHILELMSQLRVVKP